MMNRYDLIDSFRDTQRWIEETDILRFETKQMMAETRLFFPGFEAICPKIKCKEPKILLAKDTTFHCAQSQINGEDKVAVLNFANAYSPGGGVANGAMAQEECLCRSSNLYNSLTLRYLQKNYYKWNSKNTGDMGTDAVIYSPHVTVFKSDDQIPRLMRQGRWFHVDVLSCAAPYFDPEKRKPVSKEKLREVFLRRAENILAVAAANDADILVLGAFGCGVFNNPPELVADAFREILLQKSYGQYFKKVLFAIKADSSRGNNNYKAFSDCFKGDELFTDIWLDEWLNPAFGDYDYLATIPESRIIELAGRFGLDMIEASESEYGPQIYEGSEKGIPVRYYFINSSEKVITPMRCLSYAFGGMYDELPIGREVDSSSFSFCGYKLKKYTDLEEIENLRETNCRE